MAYPQIFTYTTGGTVSDRQTITYPSGIVSGDMIILQIGARFSGATFTPPSGWTKLAEYNANASMAIIYLIAGSSLSGTFDVVLSSSQAASWMCYRVSAPLGAKLDTFKISAAATGSSNQPNSPSLTSSSAVSEILWLSLFGADPTPVSVTGWPADYSSFTLDHNTGGLSPTVGVAAREIDSATQDPGAFTISASRQWVAFTVAISAGTKVIKPDGILSAEAIPAPKIIQKQFIEPSPIASAEAFGTPTISNAGYRGVYPEGIVSEEAFGVFDVLSGEGCIIVNIGGSSYPMRDRTLRIEDNVSDRSTAEFIVIDRGGLWAFERGAVVRIFDRFAQLAFAGVVDSAQRYRTHEGTFEHYITCADNHYFADKRIAAQTYESMTAGDIVRDLILDYLAAEGITVGVIEDGPTVIETVFNYIPVSEALDQLATIAGFWWAIDVDKKLYFVNPDYHSLPFSMTGYEMQRGTVQVTNKNPKYRNRQYVKGGKAITDLQTEVQFGDGSKQAFAVRYPIARVPTVEVSIGGGAWVAQTVGIKGLDTGFQWYWSKGDLVMAQEISDTPLAAADRVRVQYFGQWPIVTISERTDEVTRMQTLQGGSGRVEDVVQDAQIDTREAAFQIANSNLQKYSVNSIRVQFETLQHGLEVGRLVRIVLPDYDIDDDFLIEKLEIWQDAHLVWYRAHCLEGPSEGTWQRFFADIARRGRPQIDQENIGEDEVLITLVSFSEAIGWAESTTITPIACPVCGVGTLAGPGTIVC